MIDHSREYLKNHSAEHVEVLNLHVNAIMHLANRCAERNDHQATDWFQQLSMPLEKLLKFPTVIHADAVASCLNNRRTYYEKNGNPAEAVVDVAKLRAFLNARLTMTQLSEAERKDLETIRAQLPPER